MSEKLEPLSKAVLGALDVERARPAPPPEQVARLASRLDATFAAGAGAAAAGGGAAAAGTASGKVAGAMLGGKVMLFAAGLAVGGVGGAQLHARFAEPKVIEVTKVVEVQVPVPAPAPAPEIPEVPAPDVRAPRPVAAAPAVRSSLDTERLLVEQATAALARSQAEQALEACERHAARFPNGQLVEERESVAIRALVLAGRRAEAKQRAGAFHARFPESMLQGVIDAALSE